MVPGRPALFAGSFVDPKPDIPSMSADSARRTAGNIRCLVMSGPLITLQLNGDYILDQNWLCLILGFRSNI